MAISVRVAGTWAVATTNDPTVTVPSGYQAGDLGILVSAWRPYNIDATVDQGWTEIIDESPGTTASAAGLGSTRLFVAYKVLGSSETNPTIDRAGTITPGGQVIIVLQKDASEDWGVAALSAAVEEAMASTAMSHSLTTTGAIAANDWVFALTGVADDSSTFTRATTAISGGPTWSGNIVEYPSTHASSTAGNDMAADLIYRVASGSASSGASITVTATLSAAERVASVLFRVRTVPATQTITLGLLDASNALYAPTVIPDQFITLPLLESAADYESEVLADSPSFVLPMDESSGTLTDLVGALSAGASGSPTYGVTGPVTGHTAIQFDADTEFFTVSDDAALDLGNGPFTIEYWVARDTDTGGWQIALNKGTNAYSSGIGSSSDSLYSDRYTLGKTGIAVLGYNASGTVPADGSWHHVAITRSGTGGASTHKMYVDGSEVTYTVYSSGDTLALDDTTSALTIGKEVAGLNGKLAYIALYKSVLSSTRIAAHYDARNATGGGRQLFAPTLEQVSGGTTQSITLGLLDGANALYAPTILPQPVTVTLGVLDAANALYAPTLVPKNTISLGLLDGANALYAPTLVPKNAVSLGLLDAGNALYQPTLTPKNTLSLDLLDSGSALYAPTLVVGPASFTLPLLDSGSALYAPTLTVGPVTISLGLIDGTNALYAPDLTLAPYQITLPLLDGANALYAPTVAQLGGTQAITLGLLDAGAALYAPSLLPVNAITLPLLVSGAIWIDDGWTEPGWSEGGAALFAPQVAPAPYPITLPLLDAGSALYAPELAGGSITVVLPLLDSGPALYAPTIYLDQFVTLPLLDAGAALYAPTLAVGAVTATLPLLDAGNALYQPTLVGKNTIALPLLDGERALYDPQVWGAAQTIVVGLLDSGSALYAPTLTWSNTLVIPFLNGGAELYPPTISSVSALIYGHTRDVNGRPIPFATVDVFVTATNTFYATTTSDAVGLYQVLVETGVEYFIVAYTAVEFGTSSRSLVGV